MAGKKDFKVVIAGGSVAGLTLANMLEKLGIDYVLLEAYPEIAPQVGASIGILPNGMRILDQLNCAEAIIDLTDKPLDTFFIRDPAGKPLLHVEKGTAHLEQRHGYPIIFVERQLVNQSLYNNLKDKSKVLTSKRVVEVTHGPSGVDVTTEDGSSYSGDFLVGADGIHSAVRKTMWKLADQMKAGWIPASEPTAMPCDYKCIFGISKPMDNGVDEYSVQNVLGEGFSHLHIRGAGGRAYFFLFVYLGKTHYSPNIPRYTHEDEEALAKEHWNDKLTETLTFGDLYSNKIVSILTALPEYSFARWHFGRVMTIGDAAHKFEPLTGQGGNNAIESAAALVNALTRKMKERPTGLSDPDYSEIFQEVQDKREDRVKELIKASHDEQRVQAMETPIFKILAPLLVPQLDREDWANKWSDGIYGGGRLEMFDVPKRPRAFPFNDELASKPVARTWLSVAVVSAALVRILYTASRIPSDSTQASTSLFESITSSDPETSAQGLDLLGMLLPMIAIWTAEAYRMGNKLNLVSFPFVWLTCCQFFGIAKVAPLYFLCTIYPTGQPRYERPTGRVTPTSVAKSLLPALVIGYILPTATSFLLAINKPETQNIISFWQYAPALASLLTWAFAWLLRTFQGLDQDEFELYKKRDLGSLQLTFLFAALSSGIAHLFALQRSLAISTAPLSSLLSLVTNVSGSGSPAGQEFALGSAAILFWCLYSAHELARRGYATKLEQAGASVAMVLGTVAFGPGAVYAATWAWRERSWARWAKDFDGSLGGRVGPSS